MSNNRTIELTEAQKAAGDCVRTLLYVGRCEDTKGGIAYEYKLQDETRRALIFKGSKIGKHEQPGALIMARLPTKDGGKTPSGCYMKSPVIGLGMLPDTERVLELQLADDNLEQKRLGAKVNKDKMTERVLETQLEPLRSILRRSNSRERAALVARIIYMLTK